ncbi:MAG: small ribosomal subunit Rsm22 family protein [Chlamydiales bacterium]|nr:small ribosomal subunit Rsm22 family protein [Chlamydiales bacterium]
MKRRLIKPDFKTIIPILIGIWRRYLKVQGGGPEDRLHTREFRSVVDCIEKLQKLFENTSPNLSKDYFEDKNLLSAYLLYYWTIHYAEGMSLLSELPSTPMRVLDLASGPGAFGFAALCHGSCDVTLLDRNVDSLKLGAEIAGRSGMTLTTRHWNQKNESMPISGKYDLIILGHALNELFPNTLKNYIEKQNTFITSLFEHLNPNGYLLLVESSWPSDNKRILNIRNFLVENHFAIQAPCVYKGSCPALLTNAPCYAQRTFEKPLLVSEIQRSAKINLNSLKMSYLIVKAEKNAWPKLDEPLYRVISPPVQTRFGKRFYLCGTDGHKALSSKLEEHSKENLAFEFLQRGDLIKVCNATINKDSLSVVQDTEVSVYASCGKPVC